MPHKIGDFPRQVGEFGDGDEECNVRFELLYTVRQPKAMVNEDCNIRLGVEQAGKKQRTITRTCVIVGNVIVSAARIAVLVRHAMSGSVVLSSNGFDVDTSASAAFRFFMFRPKMQVVPRGFSSMTPIQRIAWK